MVAKKLSARIHDSTIASHIPVTGVTCYPASNVYLGVKCDMAIYAISDANITAAQSELSARVTAVAQYDAFYQTRASQVAASFQAEDLVTNKNLWMYRLANRQDGPCVKIQSLKKQILGQ